MKRNAWWIFAQKSDKFQDVSTWKDVGPVVRETISEEETKSQAFFGPTEDNDGPLKIGTKEHTLEENI